MSLKALMDIKVQVASKRDQDVLEAPGIITVISSAELKGYGGRNLHDVMRLVPALQQVYPQFIHRNSVAIRGQATPSLDKNFLILLNGKPMRDPIFYGVNAPLYEGIPLELIDRLEIIRGPGSVIYGSNAFSGVMDIITKDADNYSENILQSRIGSFGTRINEAVMSSHFLADKGNFTAAVRTHDSDGWQLKFTDSGGNQDSFKNENHAWSGFLELNYLDFNMSLFKAEVEEVQTLSNGLIADVEGRKSDRDYFALGYQHEFSPHWSSKIDLSSNSSNIAASQQYDARDTSLELMAHGDYESFDFDLGLRYRRNTLIDPSGTKVSEVDYQSAFFQLSSQLDDSNKLITGIQVIDPEVSDLQYAPRISLISRYDQNISSKLMISRAYNSPTGVEFSIFVPNPAGSGPDLFVGNPDLVPTTLDNYDLQIAYSGDQVSAALNIFYSIIENPIGLVEVNEGVVFPKTYDNLASEEHQGLELEGKLDLTSNLHFSGSYSYQTSKDSDGIRDNKLLSNHLIKTGFIYKRDEVFTFSLFNTYHSDPGNRESVANEFNHKESAYSHLTINSNYKIKHLFHQGIQLELNLYIDNALNDKAVMLADPILTSVNTQPKISERSYYAGLSLLF
jgi:outer membrane receptor for ferrienterochelin and colicin